MHQYRLVALAPHEHDVKIVPAVLRIPALETMLFPARIPYTGAQGPLAVDGKFYLLQKASDFEIAHISKVFYIPKDAQNLGGIHTHLYGQNRIRLDIALHESLTFLHETLVSVRFYEDHLNDGTVTQERLEQLIIDLAVVIQAGFINVYDSDMIDYGESVGYRDDQGKNYPAEIGWMAYFGPHLVAFLGQERFDRLKTCHEKRALDDGGMLVVLQEEPFDAHNPAHREREAQAIAELGLMDLVK